MHTTIYLENNKGVTAEHFRAIHGGEVQDTAFGRVLRIVFKNISVNPNRPTEDREKILAQYVQYQKVDHAKEPVLVLTPIGLQYALRHGLLTIVPDQSPRNAAPMEEGWKTAHQLERKFASSSRKSFLQEMEQFRIKLVDAVAAQFFDGNNALADIYVETFLIGTRHVGNRYHRALAISPEAQKLMQRETMRTEYPRKERGWQTAHERENIYGGSADRHERDMEAVARQLVANLLLEKQGISRGQAEAEITRTDVGMRISHGRPALAISPRAQAMLPEPKLRNYPPIGDWQTANQRRAELGGGRKTHEGLMHKLEQILTAQISEEITHGDIEQAKAIVRHNLFADRLTHKGPAFAGSPDAIRNLEYRIMKPDWLTAKMIKNKYGGDNVMLNGDLETFRGYLVNRFIADGRTKQSAEELVKNEYIGMRHKKTSGAPSLAVSPKALELMGTTSDWGGRSRIWYRPELKSTWAERVTPIEPTSTSPVLSA